MIKSKAKQESKVASSKSSEDGSVSVVACVEDRSSDQVVRVDSQTEPVLML